MRRKKGADDPNKCGAGVFGPTVNVGLPLNETTVADQMKKAGYATAAMGKWHLCAGWWSAFSELRCRGQRSVFLPAARGFDRYLGIPYSDDMGEARATQCHNQSETEYSRATTNMWANYQKAGYTLETDSGRGDPGEAALNAAHFHRVRTGGNFLPLVYQVNGTTKVLEQPLDFTHLAEKYAQFVTEFVEDNQHSPFFLYMPFSHVHTTAGNQPQKQFAGCAFKNSSRRGMFGDALAEADWIASQLVDKLDELKLSSNTLILFSSDNGPWMIQGKSGGSTGLHYGRSSGYWNVGKGSTWEGGVREPAFAHWPGDPSSS